MIDVINAVDKSYIYQLMSTVKLPGLNRYDSHIQMHTGTKKYDVSSAKEFQQNQTKIHCKDYFIDQRKYKNDSWKKKGQTDNIIFRTMLMLNTKMSKCIVSQVNSKNYHFVFHIPNLMAQRFLVSIIICVFIQN